MKDIRIDEKGKLYTTHINKRRVRALAATKTNVIEGTMHVLAENRLKDELNDAERFVALTDAQVFAPDGVTRLYQVQTLLLNKEEIVWVIPRDEGHDAEPGAAARDSQEYLVSS